MYGEKLIFEPYLENKADVNCAAYRKKGEIIVSQPETAFSGGVYGFKEKYLQDKQNGGKSRKKSRRTRGKFTAGRKRSA